jgi:hypothetical protein
MRAFSRASSMYLWRDVVRVPRRGRRGEIGKELETSAPQKPKPLRPVASRSFRGTWVMQRMSTLYRIVCSEHSSALKKSMDLDLSRRAVRFLERQSSTGGSRENIVLWTAMTDVDNSSNGTPNKRGHPCCTGDAEGSAFIKSYQVEANSQSLAPWRDGD